MITWYGEISKLQNQFAKECAEEAYLIALDSGATGLSKFKIQTLGTDTAYGISLKHKGKKHSVTFYFPAANGTMLVDVDTRQDKLIILSDAPTNVAAESLYSHFRGFI
jgi:hypothetical protein